MNPAAANFNTLASERTAAQAAQGYAGEQNSVRPNKDALSASTLISTALANAPGGNSNDQVTLYKSLGSQLSMNTLRPWAKGAALVAGDYENCAMVFGPDFATEVLFNADKTPSAFLMEVRRRFGDGWQASLQAAAFVQTKQREALHDSLWNKMPAGVSGFDQDWRGFDHQRKAGNNWYSGKKKLDARATGA